MLRNYAHNGYTQISPTRVRLLGELSYVLYLSLISFKSIMKKNKNANHRKEKGG